MSNEPLYLCYDIRGIQSFLFKIPRLKHIVGGSALIDRFDRVLVRETRPFKDKLLASGGGKGAFRVGNARDAEEIEQALIRHAHRIGVDIRFGRSHDYSEAANCASRLYPYLPDELDGHPCPESGLYPSRDGKPHRVVQARKWSRGNDMTRWFETRLSLAESAAHPRLLDRTLSFMRNVDEDDDERKSGRAGFRALGERNRWAVICMDGNDMGRQFEVMGRAARTSDELVAWLQRFSKRLDECTEQACRDGIHEVLRRWASDEEVVAKIEAGALDDDAGDVIVPVRPLVVGGDDITVLCHAAHATAFVQRACSSFEKYSRQFASEERKSSGIELWPRTKDHVSISAGILFCGTSVPLATAIPYAHELLSLAKRKGRALRAELDDSESQASPACVDFEAVTESMLDTPEARRRRELAFIDEDDQEIELTCRPYAVEELSRLKHDLATLELPRSMLHRLLPGLRQGKHDRQVFYARLGKHHGKLLAALDETRIGKGSGASRWRQDGDARRIDLIDMMILAKESHRMGQGASQ